ncbi:MAG: DUF349 domain-containing protein [Paludibacteraceae bacterium]|nr:DUF349 domain-containing protein [Paludibacteraceae bacterium]
MDKMEEMDLLKVQNDVENQLVDSVEEQVLDVEMSVESADYSDCTEGELVEKMKGLLKSNPESYASIKGDVESIKQNFYRKLKAKNEELKSAFLADGGEEADFEPVPNPLEDELKELLAKYKEKRASELMRQENEKKENLESKRRLLGELKVLIDESNTEDFGKRIPVFQKIQQDWKAIGDVPASDSNALWREYQNCVESFYDNLKINKELRDYDFRKNLEAKNELCEQAEKLSSEGDVVVAFRKLQVLHEKWREIGPVSRENREEIWNRFKSASTVVHKKHHDYFDKLKETEIENLEKKKALCEKLESMDLSELSSYKAWQEKSDEIIELQNEWKKIGFAPKKDNVAIYERFRSACDEFFKQKNDFFKSTKKALVDNLTQKIALCEKAEALKDSVEWKSASDKLVLLQKEWKQIGAVPKKQSEIVWKRFISACDYFFERKEKEFKSQKNEQDENLAKKKEIIEQIKSLEIGEDSDAALVALKELTAKWNQIGFVPFKEKDKIYKVYKAAIDEKFDKLNLDRNARRMDVYKANLQDIANKGQQKLQSERKRLLRQYETLTSEIATYENNIGFFSGSSKKAEGMIKDMELKVSKLKSEREVVLEKIKMLEEASEA